MDVGYERLQIPKVPTFHQDLIPKLAGKVRGNKTITLNDAEKEFEVPNLARLFRERLDIMWGGEEIIEKVCGSVEEFGRTCIKVYQSIAFYYRPFQQPQEVKKHLLRCTNAWRASREARTHHIWIRHSEDRVSDTFQGRKACYPLLYFGYTPPSRALRVTGGDKSIIPTKVRERGNNPYATELVPKEMGFAMAVVYMYVRPDGLPNPHHGCVEVQLNKQDMIVAPIESIEGAVHLIAENEEAEKGGIFLVNNHIDLETYYYVY